MVNKKQGAILNNLIDQVVEEIHPKTIILFGSRAKKQAESHADFDLAVDTKTPPIRTLRRLRESLDDIAGIYSVDLIFLNDVEKNFKQLVFKTGKVLYERN